MKKKLCNLGLALAITGSLLTGCGGSPEQIGSGAEGNEGAIESSVLENEEEAGGAVEGVEGNYTAAGKFPIVNDKVSLKVFYAPYAFVTDMEDNYATQWLEEKTNIHIDWMISGEQDAAEKINLLLGAGDAEGLPDVFYTGWISRQQVEYYGGEGTFLPLNDLIDQYAVNFKELFQEHPELEKKLMAPDGNIYFLPRYYETLHVRFPQKCWMNRRWLENVDMEVPVTTEEFYNVLKAFKEQDANGDGNPNNEIPFLCYFGTNGIQDFVMNAFVYSPSTAERFYLDENGTIVASYAQEGWREGLEYQKMLYDEGLLDNECLTMTEELSKPLFANESGSLVGCVEDWWPGFMDFSSQEAYDYVAIAPLEGPDGTRQAPEAQFNPAPMFMITSKCEDPIAAIRWADAQAIDIAQAVRDGDYEWMNLWYGKEDAENSWRKAQEGECGFTGEPAYYKTTFSYDGKSNAHWYENFLIHMGAEWKSMDVYEDDGSYNLEKVLYENTEENYLPYSVAKTVTNLSLTSEENEEFSELRTNLDTYYKECVVKFMTGAMDLDADWDGYLNELENIGLSRAIEIYQTAYDRVFN